MIYLNGNCARSEERWEGGTEGEGKKGRPRPSAYDLNMLSRSGHRRRQERRGRRGGGKAVERASPFTKFARTAPKSKPRRSWLWRRFLVRTRTCSPPVAPSLGRTATFNFIAPSPLARSLLSPSIMCGERGEGRRGRLTPFSICTAVATFEPQWHRMIYDPRIHFRRRDANREGGRGGGRRCTDTGSHGFPFHIRTIGA